MKRLALLLASSAIIATPALAADAITQPVIEPQPQPIQPVTETTTWTGIYIGGQAGAAFGNEAGDISFDPGDDGAFGDGTFDGDDDNNVGFVGGAHIGYDYEFQNNVVFGAVADINYIDAETSRSYTIGDGAGGSGEFGVNSEINYLGTVRARLGYDFDGVMPYATGGLAYAGYDRDTNSASADDFASVTGIEVDSEDDADVGYSVGGGVDVLATQNISFGLEYLYTNLGSNDYSVEAVGDDGLEFTAESDDDDLDFHTIWAKASYRFN